MKQPFFFVVFFLCCIQGAVGQAYSEYNIKGDRALDNNDYTEAQMWYAEGIGTCDLYSIKKLTEIWKVQESMRSSMRILMPRCYDCLAKQENKDSDAMYLLYEYYKYGIGIEKDSVVAAQWFKEFGKGLGFTVGEGTAIENPLNPDSSHIVQPTNGTASLPETDEDKWTFFASYTPSLTMPLGVTLGIYRNFGFYFSVKSTLTSRNSSYNCTNESIIDYNTNSPYYAFLNNKKKWSNLSITAGILTPILSNKLFVTTGLGFGRRDLLCQMVEYSYDIDYTKDPPTRTDWCLNTESSYKGLVVELGGIYRYRKLMISGGIFSVKLKDLDAYVGLGYSF